MTTFLLSISFILNVLTIFAIIILYLRQNRLQLVEKNTEKTMREMEELISTYLLEMQEENEKFIAKVKEINTNNSTTRQQISKNEVSNNTMTNQDKTADNTIRTGKGIPYSAVNAYKKNQQKDYIVDEEVLLPSYKELEHENSTRENKVTNKIEEPLSEDYYMESLLKEAVKLTDQGLSIEETAKKLNKGKTEIELLLKFRQKNQ